MSKIILATFSSHRQKAFQALGFDFAAESSNINEQFQGREKLPDKLAQQLARLKAEAVAKKHDTGFIVGFDTVGWFNNQILEKPNSKQEAFQRLQSLSGKQYILYTGVYVINIGSGKQVPSVVSTTIHMRDLQDAEIATYLEQDPDFNTFASGYDPWGHYSCTFASSIEGSYNNFLKGIPLEVVVEMLFKAGFDRRSEK